MGGIGVGGRLGGTGEGGRLGCGAGVDGGLDGGFVFEEVLKPEVALVAIEGVAEGLGIGGMFGIGAEF